MKLLSQIEEIQNIIKEKFFSSGHLSKYDKKKYVEIFENPSKREFEDVAGTSSWERNKYGDKYVRFFIDNKRKKVYIWSPDVIHSDVAQLVFGSKYEWVSPTRVAGVSIKEGGRWKMVASDSPTNIQLKWIKLDLSWAEKYISTKDYLTTKQIKSRK